MRMPAQRLKGGFVILGPCPGCQLWQLEYDDQAALSYAMITSTGIDLSAWHEAVESALQEHLDECLHLQRLLPEL